MKIEIRAATHGDIEVIAANNGALALETEHRRLAPEIVRAGVAAALADSAKGRYFVAESAGRVVGQIMHTYEWSDWRNGCFWLIQSVYVAQEARGQGVFRRLFDHIHALARAQPDVCAAAARLAGVARLERPYPPDQPSLRARLREISRRCPPPSGT